MPAEGRAEERIEGTGWKSIAHDGDERERMARKGERGRMLGNSTVELGSFLFSKYRTQSGTLGSLRARI